MFTFGLFTTHFPYLAFVVFYAYFLIFGVGKAASGEIESDEKYFQTEWFVESQNNPEVADFHFSNDFDFSEFLFAGPGNFLSAKKSDFPQTAGQKFRHGWYCSSLFCRPPPLV